jgi:WXG100 family type VII secretion target
MSIDNTTIMVQDELEGAGSYINSQAQTISDELSALVSKLAPLAETWTGTASADYESYQQEWNAAANGLFGPDGVLGAIAQAMNVTWGNYSDAEFANIQTWPTG